jgi:hypothetical protein
MTDEIKPDAADSGTDPESKQRATVHDYPSTDTDPYLVEYPDGSVEYEPNTAVNRAVFGESEDEMPVVSDIDGEGRMYDNDEEIMVDLDIKSKTAALTYDGHTVVANNYFGEIVDVVADEYRTDYGSTPVVSENVRELVDIYFEIIDGQVRQDVISQFKDRFPDDRVEQTDSGWLIDDTFVVTYEGENYLTTDKPTYERKGGEMVEMDERAQAVALTIDTSGAQEMPAPDGDRVMVGELEQRFLATVECLLYPEEYLGAELVDKVEQYKAESMMEDPIESLAEKAGVDKKKGFTAPDTREHHTHKIKKHRLSDEFNVTDELLDETYVKEYSHLAVHELALREDEFRNADFDVFEDVPNDDDERWEEINRTTGKAPISAESMRELKETMEEHGHTVHLSY